MSQELDDGSKINARAANVDYDMATDTVVFTGDALIDQPGRGNIAGGRIAYNMKSGQVQGRGEGQQRVKMQFLPKGTGAAGAR
jgi:lipopolysaccharide export system protein LptA